MQEDWDRNIYGNNAFEFYIYNKCSDDIYLLARKDYVSTIAFFTLKRTQRLVIRSRHISIDLG